MQVLNSLSSNPRLPPVKSSSADKSSADLRAQEQQEVQADDSTSAKQTARFDIDEQALQQVILHTESENNAQPSANKQSTAYDQPSDQNYTAVSAYQAVDNIAQRDHIQQTFGIDVFA